MAKTMTKTATLAHLADKTGLPKKQVEGVLDEALALACKEARKNGQFVLPGFGKLVLANRKARIGRNPQTGEPIKIPAKRVCKFRLSKSLKDTVLGKK
ncbi:MAG: DNA-binding protein [Candidatus Rokubacteria bacterium RIFCSPLOWO2_12_FULL_71_22]|nr:MAG: DNA-binding protein [Candidatus Rokubacteria bacterium RIFCSPLOWO2_12_FULL_71_22]